jgi:hypothetical protein
MKCYLKEDAINLIPLKKELMIGSKPNFDLIFSEGRSTSMVILKNRIGIEFTLKLLIKVLHDLVNYFNVSRPMSSGQITELAIEIMEEMRDLTFEEIVAFIEGIKREEYGKIYERFDAPTFWKFYWGETAEDKNSFNYKKMKYCEADATKNHSKEFIHKSDLENDLTKPRTSGDRVENFIKQLNITHPNKKG